MSMLGLARSAFGVCAPIVLALGACQSFSSGPVPAHLVADKTNTQCLEQMQSAAQRPDGPRVVLTPAAFAVDDRLSVVLSPGILDAAGQPANGRLRGLPDSFRLTLHNGACTMTREADAQTAALTACTCVAMP